MTDTDNEHLVREAAFGMNVEAFLESPIGVYLISRAETDIRNAQAALSSVDPHDWQDVQRLQNMIRVAESIQMWLADAMAQGVTARSILEDRST
jgi:hypothetical protein